MLKSRRRTIREYAANLLFVAVIAAAVACYDSTGPADGYVTVVVLLTGVDLDADGFLVDLNGGSPRVVRSQSPLTLPRLRPGRYALRLTGLAANCVVVGANPQSASVLAGMQTTVTFTVQCTSTTGTLVVETRTSGTPLDDEIYVLTLPPGPSSIALPLNGTTTVGKLPIGTHVLILNRVSSNCTVDGTISRTVLVQSAVTLNVRFDVTCSTVFGNVRVDVLTSGEDLDSDGYQVDLIGSRHSSRHHVANNGRVTLFDVPVGTYYVGLTGQAPNCLLLTPPLNSVRVRTDTVALTFSVKCETIEPIAYVSGPTEDIFVTSANATQINQRTFHSARDFDPAWSPDHKRIAFASERTGNADIFVMDADGSNVVQLTTSTAADYQPAWSPDGRPSPS
jgi:hypothetical protein